MFTMKATLQRSLIFLGLLACAGAGIAMPKPAAEPAAQDADAAAPDARWKVWGGSAGFRWNDMLLASLGIRLEEHGALGRSKREDGLPEYAVRDASALDFAVRHGNFAGFTGGALTLRGGVDLVTPQGRVSLRDMRLVARKDNPLVLDVFGNDGVAWLFIDRMMYVVEGDARPVLSIKTMDLRVAPALARLLGHEEFVGLSLADMSMTTQIHSDRGDPSVFRPKGSSDKWPGTQVPGQPTGVLYQADVFMHDFDARHKRQRPTVDGPGNGDGGVVFAPSSTLRNNRSNGTERFTFPSMSPRADGGAVTPCFPYVNNNSLPPCDPLGLSDALFAADVPWNAKFSPNRPPYNNDQHPFLIWNLFRIDQDGKIDQIGRSGVKHAWLTTNSPCDVAANDGQILSLGCVDTYSDGNNDNINDLGPRSELVPAPGLWGRCGSVWDANCDGVRDATQPALPCAGQPNCSQFAYRMEVMESDIDPTLNPGAIYHFESWYIVRDDINIFNTMQNRPVTFTYSGGIWNLGNGSNTKLRLGPAIDRWVDPASTDPNVRSSDIANDGGHARVAVKVTDLGGGRHRYDYAVMNFDFARAQTQGGSPNLRVLSNDGFTAFALPIAQSPDVTITDIEFSDGDRNAANDWTSAREANRITWTAPAGNRLNWGTMFRFSLTANAVAVEADASLTTASTSSVEVLAAGSLVPQSEAVATYAVGGTLSGLAAGESVSLQLNAGTPIQLDANDVFVFDGELIEGSSYTVAITAQPVTQACAIENEVGTIQGADVTDVLVTCVDLPPPMYSVSGSVSGLDAGRSVTVQLNGGEALVRSANGAFGFATLLGDGAAYDVTATADAPDRVCVVNDGDGLVAGADVTGVQVVCGAAPTYVIGGNVSGLVGGASVSLQLNGGEILSRPANGAFAFTGKLLDQAAFAVTIATQPVGMHCEIAGGDGNVAGADVAGIAVTCVELSRHSVGGVLSGMPAGRSIALRLNDGAALVLSSSRSFTFLQTVFDGSTYEVAVSRVPLGYGCTVVNGAGSIDGADVDDVVVTCVSLEPGVQIYGDGFE